MFDSNQLASHFKNFSKLLICKSMCWWHYFRETLFSDRRMHGREEKDSDGSNLSEY